MPRTQPPLHLPPKKKKKAKRLEIEAAAVARGTELGKVQAHKKKPLEESFKEHLGHWIDNIDPLETVAILGTTVLVHGTILGSVELLGKLVTHLKSTKGQTSLIGDIVLSPLFGFAGIYTAAAEWYGKAFAEPSEISINQQQDLFIWFVSFTIAYIMIKHGGQIVGLLDKNLSAIVGLMLA